MRLLSPTLLAVTLTGCVGTVPEGPRSGPWYAELDMSAPGDASTVLLPFLFDVESDGAEATRIHIRNGEERMVVHQVEVYGDSIRIRMPLYDSEFRARLLGDTGMQGVWHNYLRGDDYVMPFTARADDRPRFRQQPPHNVDVSGEWKAWFSQSCCDSSMALGIFRQDGGHLAGTFATETGDYRFLEGVVRGDSLYLSVFNGFQANLFSAVLRNDSLVGSVFWGKHGRDHWNAVKDPSFRLRNADSLTFLKEGYSMATLSLTDLEGRLVSPQDEAHKGKVVIIQVLGSWCPNCVDEARLFAEFHDKFHDQGLEIIGVAFERHPTKERSIAALERFRDHLGLKYPICYAGPSKKEVTSEVLPFLNHVISFPTSITIGRDGKVRRIYTGFYGPGTGARYDAYKRDMERMLVGLLAEPTP
jgi:thiol-disulfide isomerase/thioredoxin